MIKQQIENLNNILNCVLKLIMERNGEGKTNVYKKFRKTNYTEGQQFPADNMYWDEYGNPAFIDDLAV